VAQNLRAAFPAFGIFSPHSSHTFFNRFGGGHISTIAAFDVSTSTGDTIPRDMPL
jgi:hypothetical protein